MSTINAMNVSGSSDTPEPVRSTDLPDWPGLHPGTGTNDHIHLWEWYKLHGYYGYWVAVEACQICGVLKPGTSDE